MEIKRDFLCVVNQNHAKQKAAEKEHKKEIKTAIGNFVETICTFFVLFGLYLIACMI